MTAFGSASRACSSPSTLHAIEESEDQPQEALCHRPPQDPRRHERDRDGQQSAQREELAHRPAAAEKQGGGNRGDRHRQGVDDVVGRDHARAVRRFAFVLQDRVERHREETAGHRHANEVHDNPPASGRAQEDGYGRQLRDCRAANARCVEVPGEEGHRGGGDGHEARADFAVQEPLGQDRSEADTDREERQHHRHDLLVRGEHVLGKGGESRDHGGAKQPEPGHREDRQKQGWPRRHVADDGDRVSQQAWARSIGCGWGSRGNLTRGQPAQYRTDNAEAADDERALGEEDHTAAEDGAEQDGQECAGLDEGVARDQFVVAQVLRQQGVLDGAEHGRVGAEAEERREEERYAFSPQTDRAEGHDGDFGQLDEARDVRLVDAIRERARSAREKEERRDEDRAGEHDERGGVQSRLLGQPEGHHDAHGALQQVVIEGAEELGDEQRCKPTRRQELDKWRSHDKSPKQKSRQPRPPRRDGRSWHSWWTAAGRRRQR